MFATLPLLPANTTQLHAVPGTTVALSSGGYQFKPPPPLPSNEPAHLSPMCLFSFWRYKEFRVAKTLRQQDHKTVSYSQNFQYLAVFQFVFGSLFLLPYFSPFSSLLIYLFINSFGRPKKVPSLESNVIVSLKYQPHVGGFAFSPVDLLLLF